MDSIDWHKKLIRKNKQASLLLLVILYNTYVYLKKRRRNMNCLVSLGKVKG